MGETRQASLFDQRGTGKSVIHNVNNSTINLDLLVEDLENLRKTLKVKKMTILGHAWGAMYAMLYAKNYPKRIKNLVLVSPGGVDMAFYDRYRNNLLAKYSTQELTRLKYLNQLRRAGRADAKLEKEFRTLEFKARIFDVTQLKTYSEILAKGKRNDAVLQFVLGQIQDSYDVKEAFTDFDAEVFIIQGKECPIGEDTALEVLANFSNARIEWVHACGHFPWVEKPNSFYEAISAFLK